jgi:hypothetical protein
MGVYLEHDEVLVDDPVVGEATHGGDVLLGHIILGGSAVSKFAAGLPLLPDLVHLLVHLRSVVEAALPGAGHGPGHTSRMPGTDAGNL